MDLAPSNLNLCLAEKELVTADMRDTRSKRSAEFTTGRLRFHFD